MLDTATYNPRLKALYRAEIKPAMKEEFGYSQRHADPAAREDHSPTSAAARRKRPGDSKKAKSAAEDLTAIAGQQAVPTLAKKSIAGFRVRGGA